MKNLLEVRALTAFLSSFAVTRIKHFHYWETATSTLQLSWTADRRQFGLELKWEKEKDAGLVWEKNKKGRIQQGTASKGVLLNSDLEWRSRVVTCLFTFLCHSAASTRQDSRQRQSQALRSHLFALFAFLFTFPFTKGHCQTAAGIIPETTEVQVRTVQEGCSNTPTQSWVSNFWKSIFLFSFYPQSLANGEPSPQQHHLCNQKGYVRNDISKAKTLFSPPSVLKNMLASRYCLVMEQSLSQEAELGAVTTRPQLIHLTCSDQCLWACCTRGCWGSTDTCARLTACWVFALPTLLAQMALLITEEVTGQSWAASVIPKQGQWHLCSHCVTSCQLGPLCNSFLFPSTAGQPAHS